jgi:HEAT repeat protein
VQQFKSFNQGDLRGLEQALYNRGPAIRAFAAQSLATLGPDPYVLYLLGIAARDCDESVRCAALVALSHFKPASATVVPMLCTALKDRNVEVRRQAARSLVALGPAPDVTHALCQVLQHLEPAIAAVALEGLKNASLTQDDAPALARALHSKHSDVRVFVATALGGIGARAKEAVPALTEGLQDEDKAVRRQAATSLGTIGPKAWLASRALAGCLQDPDPELRQRAAAALGKIGPDARAAAPALVRAMKEPGFREHAESALLKIGPEAAPALADALQEKADYDLRMAQVRLLGKMGADAMAAVSALTDVADGEKRKTIRLAARASLEKIAQSKRKDRSASPASGIHQGR